MKLTHKERCKRRKKMATYCQTHTIQEAVKYFKVTQATIYAACRENGVEPTSKLTHISTLKILYEVFINKRKQTDVANEFGVTKQRVNTIVALARKAGWDV